jgi:hypothetical protein
MKEAEDEERKQAIKRVADNACFADASIALDGPTRVSMEYCLRSAHMAGCGI